MSQFDAMMMMAWLVSLVIVGGAGMTLLLRLALTALFLFHAANNWIATVDWTAALRVVSDRLQAGGTMRLNLTPCD